MKNNRRERIYTDKATWGNSIQIAIAFQKADNDQKAGVAVAHILHHYNEMFRDIIESDMLPESKDRILSIIVRLFRFSLREGFYAGLNPIIKNAVHYYLKTKYKKWHDKECDKNFPARDINVEQLVRPKKELSGE